MKPYLVRSKNSKELVGVYCAGSAEELYWLVDETVDPWGSECMELKSGFAVRWFGQAPVIPMKDHEQVDMAGADLSFMLTYALHGADQQPWHPVAYQEHYAKYWLYLEEKMENKGADVSHETCTSFDPQLVNTKNQGK